MEKAKTRLTALLLFILSPILIPLAALHRQRWNIFYFYLIRWHEFRTGEVYGVDDD